MKKEIALCSTTKITATSRASVKVNDNYYTLEFSEERMVPDIEGVDLKKEKELLWDEVNSQVDKQVEDVLKMYGER